jgi:hypothetical protein
LAWSRICVRYTPAASVTVNIKSPLKLNRTP